MTTDLTASARPSPAPPPCVAHLQLLWEEALAGSREDGHELLKWKEGGTLLKVYAEVCKPFDVRYKGGIVEWIKPTHAG